MLSLKAIPFAIAVAVALILSIKPVRAEERTKDTYLRRCASCHGADGRGDGASTRWLRTKPTDFHNCNEMKKLSDDTIFTATKFGPASIDLPPDMPGFFDRLSDSEIVSLVSYVRGFCRQQ